MNWLRIIEETDGDDSILGMVCFFIGWGIGLLFLGWALWLFFSLVFSR